jgi:hypothetical protein
MFDVLFDYEAEDVFEEAFKAEIIDDNSFPEEINELVMPCFEIFSYFQLDLEKWRIYFSQIAEIE